MTKKKKSVGDLVQKKINIAADAVKNAVDDVELPDIKIPDRVKDLVEKENSPAVQKETDTINVLSTDSALKIIYYLMAVNKKITHEEEEKYNLIGKELDPNFDDNRERIVRVCKKHMEKTAGDDDYYNVIQRGVRTAISLSKPTKDSIITPKLLVWDLLTIAYSDNHYDKSERKLIRYIVKKLNVDESEFLEMESSFLTLIDLQKESEWIKGTDRQYKAIEEIINELADRKAVILESVNDLITL